MSIFKSALRGVGVVLFALSSPTLQAQTLGVDSACVTLDKAGKLKSALKNYDLQAIKYLKVNGNVSEKDLKELVELPHLQNLYFEDAVYVVGGNDRVETQEFTSSNISTSETNLMELELTNKILEYEKNLSRLPATIQARRKQEIKDLKQRLAEIKSQSVGNETYQTEPSGSPKISAENGTFRTVQPIFPEITKLNRFFVFPYAEDKKGEKIMIKLHNLPFSVLEYGINYQSVFSEACSRLIIYPKSEKTDVGLASRINFMDGVNTVQIFNREYLSIKQNDELRATLKSVPNERYAKVIELVTDGKKSYYINEFNGDYAVLSNIVFIGSRSLEGMGQMSPVQMKMKVRKQKKGGAFNYTEASNIDRIDIKVSEEMTSVPTGGFKNFTTLRSFTGLNVKEIAADAFNGCSQLEKIDCPNVENIGANAFSGTKLTTLVLPASLKAMSSSAFAKSNIQEVEFLGEYPPEVIGTTALPHDLRIIVPKGCRSNYQISVFEPLAKKEAGVEALKLVINSTEPGALYKQIKDEDVPYIEELTVSGQLYDIDMESICKCENLRVLDMEKAFIVKSPETIKKEIEEKKANREAGKALAQFFGMAAESIETKYQAGVGNKFDVEYANAVSKLFDAITENDGEIVIANENCLEPELYGLKRLEKVVYPKWLKSVYIPSISTLRTIIFPPSVESVGGGDKIAIKTLELPSSVRRLSVTSFRECPNLESVNLGNTSITTIDACFNNCPMLKEVNLYGAPVTSIEGQNGWGYGGASFSGCPNLKKFNSSTVLSNIEFECFAKSGSPIGYFYTKERPRNISQSFTEIHIPRGTKAGWGKRNNYDNYTLVDDIDPNLMSDLMTYDYEHFRLKLPIDAWEIKTNGDNVIIKDETERTIILISSTTDNVSIPKEMETLKKGINQRVNFGATQKSKFNSKWDAHVSKFTGSWDGVPCTGKVYGFKPKTSLSIMIVEIIKQGSAEKHQQIYDALEIR